MSQEHLLIIPPKREEERQAILKEREVQNPMHPRIAAVVDAFATSFYRVKVAAFGEPMEAAMERMQREAAESEAAEMQRLIDATMSDIESGMRP